LKIVLLVVLVLDKEPSEYDDEDEYNPLDPAPMIAESGPPPFSCDVVPLKGAFVPF